MPVLLLSFLGAGLTIGAGFVWLVIRVLRQKQPVAEPGSPSPYACPYEHSCSLRRPDCWLAVKSRNVLSVQSVLGLHNPKPCSWADGLAGAKQLFIAPPVRGWILVIGSGLPDPSEDVDACFRLVMELSRKLGQVQFFSASRIVNHHAWVRAESGRVLRAYAWTGKTVWHQGERTVTEEELGLKCRDYAAPEDEAGMSDWNSLAPNVDKVPLLAARWSLDPAGIDERLLEECGVAGEPSRRY